MISSRYVARRAAPGARVVYVDIDPVAVALWRIVLAGTGHVAAVQADVRRPRRLLHHPQVGRLLDLTRPVGLLAVGLLPFVADADDPAAILAHLREATVAGSYLVLCHACWPPHITPRVLAAREAYRATPTWLTLRTREEILALLDGWRLVEPGVVSAPRWRPDRDDPAGPVPVLAGVAQHR
jgi:hypothetical protein